MPAGTSRSGQVECKKAVPLVLSLPAPLDSLFSPQINSKSANLHKIGQTTYNSLFLLKGDQAMSDKVVIKVLKVPFNTEGLPRGSGSESFPVLPAPVSPSALSAHNFPPSWCFPSHAHALTSEPAAGLALGLFNPVRR